MIDVTLDLDSDDPIEVVRVDDETIAVQFDDLRILMSTQDAERLAAQLFGELLHN